MNTVTWAMVENMVLYVSTAFAVVMVCYVSDSLHGLWCLSMMMYTNTIKTKQTIKKPVDQNEKPA